MKKTRGFWSGFITCALLISMIGTAFAAYTRQETLHFNGIKLMLDGELVAIMDSTGAATEPFIINGTTYLPVSSVAKLLGMGVEWDGANQTVKLTTGGVKPEPQGNSGNAGNVVYNDHGLKITYTGSAPGSHSLFAHEFYFLIENTTDKNIQFTAINLSINGYMASGLTGDLDGMVEVVAAGKKANGTLYIYESTLTKNGISKIEDVEFVVRCMDIGTYSNIGDSPIISVSP